MAILEFEPVTEDDRVIHWRAEVLERAGYAREDVVGEHGHRLVHVRSRLRCQRPTAMTKAASAQWKKIGMMGPSGLSCI